MKQPNQDEAAKPGRIDLAYKECFFSIRIVYDFIPIMINLIVFKEEVHIGQSFPALFIEPKSRFRSGYILSRMDLVEIKQGELLSFS